MTAKRNKLTIMLVMIIMLFIAGFRTIGRILIMEKGEIIFLVCDTKLFLGPPVVSPEGIEFQKLSCDEK